MVRRLSLCRLLSYLGHASSPAGSPPATAMLARRPARPVPLPQILLLPSTRCPRDGWDDFADDSLAANLLLSPSSWVSLLDPTSPPPLAMRPTHRPTRSSLRAPARCSPHRPMGTTRCSPRHTDRGRGRGEAPGRAVRAGVPHWRQDDAHDIPIAHVPAPQVRYRRGRSPVKDGPCVLLLPPGGEVAMTLCFTTSTTST